MENITRIQNSLRNGEYVNNPIGASQDHAILAGEYSWICGQLEMILQRKPAIWNTMRESGKYKSDNATERAWEATTDGINEQGLKLRAKGIEKMLSALKSLIRIAENEAKNNY